MYAPRRDQIQACLDNVVRDIQYVRDLDLTDETDLVRALEKSQSILGALALYRSMLKREGEELMWATAA